MKNKKRKPWIRLRHRVIYPILRWILRPYIRLRYGLSVRMYPEQGKRNYLILMNHQTAFDQFFVNLAFRGPVYCVTSEDLLSNGWVSRLINWLVAPIPIRKSMTDARAVMTCMRVAREGGNIAMAPEGNRTYSGLPCHMKPSVASLVRALKLPVAIFRIEGGYGVHPRWSDVIRRGGMKAGVTEVIEPEQYAAMTDEELFALLTERLYVDETDLGKEYRHKKSAEYLERAIYWCPRCGLSRFESHGEEISCLGCGATVRYLPTLELLGVDREFPYRTVAEWYEAQDRFMLGLDLSPYAETPVYTDVVDLWRVIPYQKKEALALGVTLSVYADRYELRSDEFSLTLPFSELIAVTVLGRNKLNFYRGEGILQIKGDKRFNALKHMHIYYRAKQGKEGAEDAEFLGI